MSFQTNAARQGGYYGRLVYDSNNKNYEFEKLGREVVLERVTHNIENDDASLRLSFDYMGERRHLTIPRKELADNTLIQTLTAKGADVTKKHFDILVDTLRQQEEEMEFDGYGLEKVYTHLGWLNLPTFSDTGQITGSLLCYRADKLVGVGTAKYAGNYSVSPKGSLDEWCEMVRAEVLGNPVLELVLIAALSAVVNGLISAHTTGENPIVHICCASGKGKTTALYLAASVSGEPYDGERRVYNKNGTPSSQISVYGSWSATENATLGRCAGNRGCLVILNELGKYKGADMSNIVYNLSEGTDKARMTKELNIRQMEGYSTTILSVGEHSLLERCHNKADGLRVRVLELDMPMTTSAENADRIKAVSRKHNGWAAPMMAEYILQSGSIKMVLEIYDRWRSRLLELWPDTPSRERFVSKFPALFLTAAELAKAALGIAFHEQEIIDFFLEYERQHGGSRNSSRDSYDVILEKCRINVNKFITRYDKTAPGHNAVAKTTVSVPTQDCWGRITTMERDFEDGRIILQEVEIRKTVLDRLLCENGFQNKKTCLAAWKTAGVLNFEDATHLCRKRKLDATAEEVYVLRVFATEEEANDIRVRRQTEECKRLKKLKASKSSQLLTLMEESEAVEYA